MYRQTSHDIETLRKLTGKFVVATKVNMMHLKKGINVGTNESKDEGFCPKCGRELVLFSTGSCYSPHCGFQEREKLPTAIEKGR